MNNTAPGFCNWLQGILDAEVPFDEALTKKVQEKLSQAFLHDIDTTFPPNLQKALQAAHKGLAYSSLHGEYDPKLGLPRC